MTQVNYYDKAWNYLGCSWIKASIYTEGAVVRYSYNWKHAPMGTYWVKVL